MEINLNRSMMGYLLWSGRSKAQVSGHGGQLVVGQASLFERAADALRQALDATDFGEEALLLEEAIRLNRLALEEERAKLAEREGASPRSINQLWSRPNSSGTSSETVNRTSVISSRN